MLAMQMTNDLITAKQRDCLLLAMQMKTNKEIARHLGLSPSTVAQRMASSYRRLQVFNRKQAVLKFAELEGIPAPIWAAGDPLVTENHPIDQAVFSSGWTGIRTHRENVIVIKKMVPILLDGLGPLIDALEDKRYNDPDAMVALDAAKELHHCLTDLIHHAESGFDNKSIALRWIEIRERAKNLLTRQTVFFAASPILTMGTVAALEVASKTDFGDESVATVWAGLVAASIFSKR